MKPPRTQAEYLRAQAIDALRRGEAALAREDHATAHAWLGRARRIVPDDPAVAFALASAMLGLHDPEAIGLFKLAAEGTHTREAWLGLCAACWQQNDMPQAVAALTRVLSGHILPAPLTPMLGMAEAMAVSAKAPGWCGVTASGDARILRLVTSQGLTPRVQVDGKTIRGDVLPPGRVVTVLSGDRAVLGSPIDLDRLRRAEGFVAPTADGGLEGWIWIPADPDAAPKVTISATGPQDSPAARAITLHATDTSMPAQRPLARPRRFSASSKDLAGLKGKLAVTGPDGRALAGSPVDPESERRAAIWIARPGRARRTLSAPHFGSRPRCSR